MDGKLGIVMRENIWRCKHRQLSKNIAPFNVGENAERIWEASEVFAIFTKFKGPSRMLRCKIVNAFEQ